MIYYLPSLTVLLIFACLISYQYIQELRKENKALKVGAQEEARRAAEVQKAEWAYLIQSANAVKETPKTDPPPTTPIPLSGIGPTAIRDREERRYREEQANSTPPFTKPALGLPEDEIVARVRNVMNGSNN